MINVLNNPDFENGSTAYWTLETGWVVGIAGSPIGDTYSANYTGPGTAALRNTTPIYCTAGDLIIASCWALGEVTADGYAVLRITYFDVNHNEIQPSIPSMNVTNNYVWASLYVRTYVPDNPQISYAQVEFAVIGQTTSNGRWFCLNFYGALIGNHTILKQGMGYYLKLFTSQYRLSTNLIAWQKALMQPIADLTTCMTQFNVEYDIDVAVGAQLDVLGELIGVSRTVPFQPSNSVSPLLDDDTYRFLLRATLAKNLWDGHITSMYQIWQTMFPTGTLVVVDNQNMTANVRTTGAFTSIEQDLINNGMIVPRPEGVQYNPSTGPAGTPTFGFDYNNLVVAGFDTGVFA